MTDNQVKDLVEEVARHLCLADDMDPDLTLGGDGQNYLWMEYERQARARIQSGAMITRLFTAEKELDL